MAALSGDKVAALGDAMRSAEGRVLIFCATGTRSTYLWALARAREGMATEPHRPQFPPGRLQSSRPLLPWLKPREDEGGGA